MSSVSDHLDGLAVADGSWTVDPERSEVGFAAKSTWGMSTVRGTFGACQGNLSVHEGVVSGELAIDARSLETGNRRRDRHLSSPDFFDAERHPWIRFTLTAVTRPGRDAVVAGELRIRDIHTQLELPVDVEQISDGALRLMAMTAISRTDVGVAWNWLGMIRDQTTVHAQITLSPA